MSELVRALLVSLGALILVGGIALAILSHRQTARDGTPRSPWRTNVSIFSIIGGFLLVGIFSGLLSFYHGRW